ncbi:MAG: hypothetical protein QXL88_00850 [Candidatus Pacearchaeota archaeon]
MRKLQIRSFEFAILLILFIIATTFFIIQHAYSLKWDFSAYVLNAKYLFSNGSYFEWLRLPLVTLLIGIFSFITFGNYTAAEYFYIIFVSFLFFLASVNLAKKLRINSLVFYALMLSPSLLLIGLSEGTELLVLTFLMFALNFLFSEARSSAALLGIFIGLASLTHYTALAFVFLFFVRKPLCKRACTSLIFFLVVVLPWFLYNFFVTGSFLTSIVDAYAQNIYFRRYLFMPFNWTHFFKIFSYYCIFFVLGIIICFKKLKHKEMNCFSPLIMLLIFFLVLFSYSRIPLKTPRYLFSLSLPIAFFSTFFFEKLKEKSKKLFVIAIIAIVLFNFIFAFSNFFVSFSSKEVYKNALESLDKKCMYASDHWVYLNYFGFVAEPMPWDQEELLHELEKGKRFVIFGSAEPEYLSNSSFLETLPKINKTSNYLVLGNETFCMEPYKVDTTYLEGLRKRNITKLSNCQIIMPYPLEFLCKVIK